MQKIKDDVVPRPNWCIYNTNPAPTAQGSLWKDCKNQRDRAFALRSCLLRKVRSYTHLCHQCDCPNHELIRITTVDMLNWMGEAHEASTLQKTYRQLRSAKSGRNCLPQERALHFVIQYQIISLKSV